MHLCREIESLSDLEEMCEGSMPYQDNGGPCYQQHVIDTECLDEKIHAGDFLSLFAQDCNDQTLITYSVTSLESNYEQWVQVAQTVPGATVAVVDRGDRFCYFCCVPTVPNMDMV
jgi:hypothetical protein